MWWLSVACVCVLVVVSGCALVRTNGLAGRARKLHEESWRCEQRQDLPGGVAVLRELEALAPGNPLVLNRLGLCLAREGKEEEAIAALRRAVECGLLMGDCEGDEAAPAAIRDDPRMVEVRRMGQGNVERFLAARDDPYAAVSATSCPDASSIRAIRRHYGRLRRRLQASGRWLGPWPTYEEDWRYTRGTIDALREWIEANPGSRKLPDAYLAMVESYGDLQRPVGLSGPVGPGTAERMRQVVEDFAGRCPDSRLLPAARYLLLKADWEVAMRGLLPEADTPAEARRETVRRFARSFMELADGKPERRTEGLAICRALSLDYAENEPDVRARLVARLRVRMRQDRTVRREAWRYVRVPLLQELGTPEFRATDTAGKVRCLDDYRGKLLVLDFWATWCGPCAVELTTMKKLYAQYGGNGVEFLGVALEGRAGKSRDQFVAWCEGEGVTWPQIHAGRGWGDGLVRSFHIQSVPRLVLIDAEGQVAGEGHTADGAERWIRQQLER